MDTVRFGLSVRALRRRRGWTQEELGRRAGLSRSTIARTERGEAHRFTVQTLERLIAALGARLLLRAMWQGEALDRLLDAEHARLVDDLLRRLDLAGWEAQPEVTFVVRGERGAIDVFAHHRQRAALLVVEVKTVVPDVQALLAGIDRKARLAPLVAREPGWPGGPVSRLLVLPADRTARRRLDRFAATFDRALPARTVEVRRWLTDPGEPIAGVLFVSGVTQQGGRHRVASAARGIERRSLLDD